MIHAASRVPPPPPRTGRLTFHVFAALAEFERDLIRERTTAGLAAARARGRAGGRRPTVTPDKLRVARELRGQGDMTMAAIARTVGVSRASLYRALQQQGESDDRQDCQQDNHSG